jgi:hypothetical protein
LPGAARQVRQENVNERSLYACWLLEQHDIEQVTQKITIQRRAWFASTHPIPRLP